MPQIDQQDLFFELNHLVGDFDGTGELERLEDALSEFNLFEALGSVNAELRHSNFLGWLFDPNNNHGLGDIVVKRFLQRALYLAQPNHELSAVNLDLMDLSDLDVRREWFNIDLLLISQTNKIVVAIENKIGASESKEQLQNYKKRIDLEYPSEDQWKKRFIFLTIDGAQASISDYIPFSHRQVTDLLETTVANRKDAIADEVSMAIKHYTQMMRRHHMEDSELIALAQRIYAKHRNALEFVFMHRPDAWAGTRKAIINKLKASDQFDIDASTDRTIYVRCLPKSWSKWQDHLSLGSGWKTAGSDQFLLFEIRTDTSRERARVQLVLGPGAPEIRSAIVSQLLATGLYKSTVYPVWTTVMSKPWRNLSIDEQEVDPEKNATALFADLEQLLLQHGATIETALTTAFEKLA